MLNETGYEHIELTESGAPRIAGSTAKVVEIVVESLANGWSPEDIQSQHPTLSMAQIHSALAYYWDHKDEIDRDIDRRLKNVEKIQSETPVPLTIRQLKSH